MANRIYKNPLEQAQKLAQPKSTSPYFDFANDKVGDLLYKFLQSSGWGYIGNPINKASYMIEGPDLPPTRFTRQQIIDELNERKRIDDEEDGDFFDFARGEGYDFTKEKDYPDFAELNDFQDNENWKQFKKRKGW